MEPTDELDKLIARWKRMHRNRSLAPPIAGLGFLAVILPTFFSVCGGVFDPNKEYFIGVVFWFTVLLLIFLGFSSLYWRAECDYLLGEMLNKYDDIRIVPVLIHALDPRYHKHFPLVSHKLVRLLNRLTLDDSALLTEREYQQLHHYLLNYPTYSFEVSDGSLPIAILRAIQTMGHTPSIGAVQTYIRRVMPASNAETYLEKSARECLTTLLELQKQAKHNDTLLRPSQAEATPETLLRAAMPTEANADDLLKPSDAPDEEDA